GSRGPPRQDRRRATRAADPRLLERPGPRSGPGLGRACGPQRLVGPKQPRRRPAASVVLIGDLDQNAGMTGHVERGSAAQARPRSLALLHRPIWVDTGRSPRRARTKGTRPKAAFRRTRETDGAGG